MRVEALGSGFRDVGFSSGPIMRVEASGLKVLPLALRVSYLGFSL
jgi:hypothetical protein